MTHTLDVFVPGPEDPESKKHRKQANRDIDEVLHRLPMRIYMAIIWLAALGLFCYYISQIVGQYLDNKASPSSSLSVESVDQVDLPRVVICNWNQYNGTDLDGLNACESCRLNLSSCTVISTGADCSNLLVRTPVLTDSGYFDCFTFNGDEKNTLQSTSTGYNGSYSTVWTIVKPTPTTPPSTRAGLQASFLWAKNPLSEIPAAVFSEYRFAPYSYDTIFSVEWNLIEHSEKGFVETADTPKYFNYYDTKSALVNLVTNSSDPKNYVGVSFTFAELNKNVNLYFTSYTIENLFGDFAGMIGTLMGLDVVKVAAGSVIIYLSARLRTLAPIEDHFNA